MGLGRQNCKTVLWELVRSEFGICKRNFLTRRLWGSGRDVLAQNYDEHLLDFEVKMGLKILLLFKMMNVLSFQSRCCET